jgi:hypothetical protein
VKEEDEDWLIYHLIPASTPTTVAALVERSGLDAPMVEASLARLERSCLIERAGSTVRVLTFGESLIRNQIKYTDDLPFTIENGVIKERKR